MRTSLKGVKGQAGLSVLLSVIVMLFVIGFLVMIFAMMGGQMFGAVQTDTTTAITNITTGTVVNETGIQLPATLGFDNCALTVTNVINATDPWDTINSDNYTVTDCSIAFSGGAVATVTRFNNSEWNITGSYRYDANNTASTSIDATSGSLSDTTDWFGIIIVITAMIVLILLTVIIISAIRSSGLIAGGESSPSGANRTSA